MSNTRLLVIIAAVVAVGLAVMLWLWSGERAEQAAVATEDAVIALFFPDEEGSVVEEARQVADLPQGADARAQRVVAELLLGPVDEGPLVPLLPTGTKVEAAFVRDDGTCVIELASEALGPPPQMGSRQEAELFESLLRSLAANVEGVSQVVLLWNGRQPESFGGHLDTTRPVNLEKTRLVASPEATAP